jgi:NAD(P)-dependent dehydrogenase (short-subunit alcohol dehydrogenase family)
MSVFRDNLLEGKTAFVAGGTSGINLAIARRLAGAGAKVTVLGRNAEKAQKAAEGIAGEGGVSAHASADVRDYGAMAAAFAEHRARFGEIDVLVNGAAGNFPAPALGMSSNGFRAVVDIDLMGAFHGARAAYEHLRKPGAVVLNISAPQAFQAAPLQSHVCAAKAGVDMLTRCLAIEWGASGVRVNSITPGPIDETEGMYRLAPTEEHRQRALGGVPLGRFGNKDEIADLALFLCTPAASYITGAVLVCDGGQSLLGFGSWAG